MPLKFANNQSLTSVTALPSSVPTDNLILISTQTASNSANISFTTGLNSTYDVYEFKFIDIHPRTDNVNFTFNLSTDSGSNYNVTKTTTVFTAFHDEGDTTTALVYADGQDLAQSTGYQQIANVIGNDSKKCIAGSMQLFNPSSTTYVKHFISRTSRISAVFTTNYMADFLVAGYGNTTSAVNAIRFQMDSGNFDGTIKLYGVKKS
jgi:hypothetical protein